MGKQSGRLQLKGQLQLWTTTNGGQQTGRDGARLTCQRWLFQFLIMWASSRMRYFHFFRLNMRASCRGFAGLKGAGAWVAALHSPAMFGSLNLNGLTTRLAASQRVHCLQRGRSLLC